jgi:hypothetical protein
MPMFSHPDEIKAIKISSRWNGIKRFHPDEIEAKKISLGRLDRLGRQDSHGLTLLNKI